MILMGKTRLNSVTVAEKSIGTDPLRSCGTAEISCSGERGKSAAPHRHGSGKIARIGGQRGDALRCHHDYCLPAKPVFQAYLDSDRAEFERRKTFFLKFPEKHARLRSWPRFRLFLAFHS